MMKKALNIGIDFDDVIAHSHTLKPVAAKELYGVEIHADKFRKEFVIGSGVLTPDEYLNAVRKVYLGSYPMIPVDGSLETIEKLKKEGNNLRIITNRSLEDGTLKPAQDWMIKYNLDVPITGVRYGNSKAGASAGLDIFIDDDPAKLGQLVGVVPHLLFFCWPHNKHEQAPENSVRVNNWDEIFEYIKNNLD